MMEKPTTVRLDLRAPLDYAEEGLDPFGCTAGEGDAQEFLFCFDIDADQAGRIDPEADAFLGPLVFSGRSSGGAPEAQPSGGESSALMLPAGLYLFTQCRQALGRGECIGLAMEQQKDGLWERLRLESRLYIRRLFEDGSEVTQLFRPFSRRF